MPNYYNPYNYFPVGYANNMGYAGMQAVQPQQMMPQQSMAPAPISQPVCVMGWVDGEIEARGRQMPQNATQFAMWDTNAQKIYFKSLNPMGMPNPMQILHYTVEEQPQTNVLPAGQSGNQGTDNGQSGTNGPDMSQYVTRDELEQIRQEMRNAQSGTAGGHMNGNQNNAISAANNNQGNNQNGNGGNRGGNR